MDMPFGGEVGLGVASQAYWWHNKYAPRKPKYFNRCVFVFSSLYICVCACVCLRVCVCVFVCEC
jgi:hypothetical protein